AVARGAPPVAPRHERQPRGARSRALELAHVLRAVPAAARHRDLVEGAARHRVEGAAVQAERGRCGVEPRVPVQLHRAPARVAQHVERLAGEQPRRLVLAVAVPRRAGEDRHDDLRPEPADHGEDVGEERVARPEAERFGRSLGEPEVVGAGEVLLGAVEPARGEQLLGAEDAELGAELGPEQVLSALAAGERQVRRARAQAAREDGEQLGVFVVGVGADHEHAFARAELLERRGQRRDPAGPGRGELPRGRAGGAEHERKTDPERAPHYCERYTTPAFITKRTRWSSVMSRSGSPATATRSADIPGATAPSSGCPRSSAARLVAAWIACIGVMPYWT